MNQIANILIGVVVAVLCVSCAAKLTPLEKASRSFEAHEYDKARVEFEAVLATGEDSAAAHYYLGRIALQADNIDGAVEHLEEAVSLEDANSEYHLRLGVAYAAKIQKVSFMERGALAPKILTEFQRAVELDPTNIDARSALAQFYLQAPPMAGGSEDKAMEQVDAIRAIDAHRGHLFMAQLHEGKKHYDEAEAELKAALALDSTDAEVHYRIGMLNQARENYPAAFEAFEACLSIDREYSKALYQVARTAIFAESNYDRGIECLNLYLDNETEPGQPTWAHAYWRRGMIYEKLGDVEKAKQDFAAALQIDPTVEGAKKGLERLR